MVEKITLDRLTQDSVSFKKQNFVIEVSEPYREAIFAVWGDTPTVDELSVD